MEEKKGHFVKGVWVDEISEPEPVDFEEGKNNDKHEDGAGKAPNDDIDKLIAETAGSVKNAVDSVINLGNTIIGTKKGRREIEKKAQKAGEKLLKSLEDAIESKKKNH